MKNKILSIDKFNIENFNIDKMVKKIIKDLILSGKINEIVNILNNKSEKSKKIDKTKLNELQYIANKRKYKTIS